MEIPGLREAMNAHYGINDALVTAELIRKQFMEDNKMTRKITLIGSIKHSREAILDIYNRLTLRGNTVMLPYMGIITEDIDADAIERLHALHREKMNVADFVIVVDQDGYIGKDTMAEIKWCESNGVRIIYASDLGMVNRWLEPNCCDSIRPSDRRNRRKEAKDND